MRSLLKLTVLAALLALPLALFSWFFWPTPYAYRTVEHTVVRIHRFTDRVDILRNTGWQAMKPTPAEAPAPTAKYAPGFHSDISLACAPITALPPGFTLDPPDCLGTPVPGEPGEYTIDPRCLDKAPEKPVSPK